MGDEKTMSEEVFIHVGYPKCGSTFLQSNVFPYMTGVHFIHKFMWNQYGWVHPHFVFECALHDGMNLISSESLTGSMSVHDCYADGFVLMDRLKKVYPDAHVILVERERESWLSSLYQQFLADAGASQFIGGYDDWYQNHLNHDILRFDEYRARLVDVFDDVLLLDFDMLRRDTNRFINRICEFMDVGFPEGYVREPAKTRLTDRQLRLVRFFGRFGFNHFSNRYVLGLLRRLS